MSELPGGMKVITVVADTKGDVRNITELRIGVPEGVDEGMLPPRPILVCGNELRNWREYVAALMDAVPAAMVESCGWIPVAEYYADLF